jgi:hypothetical protein
MSPNRTQPADRTPAPKARKGAVGKALLVYLGTGSLAAAAIVYFLASGMGC